MKQILDKNGQPCFSKQDAEKLADMVAHDSAQPFSLPSSCGYRTELMIGRLLEAGASPHAVARVYQAVPDGEDNKNMYMRAKDDGADRVSYYNLLGVPEGTVDRTVQIGSDLKAKFLPNHRLLLQNMEETKGWNKPEGRGFMMSADNAAWEGKNHITAGIYVLDPATNEARLTVIDPHLAAKGESALMTPLEWKNRVHCEDSVVIAGKIGQLSEILSECLTQKQKENLDSAITKEGGSKFAGLKSLNPAQYDRVAAVMFGLDPDKKQGCRDFTMASASHFQETVTTDWDKLTRKERQDLVKDWAAELKPLRDLQNMEQTRQLKAAASPPSMSRPKGKPAISKPRH